METQIVYSELYDLFLLLRQIFSNERFRPFNPIMCSVEKKLTSEQMKIIHTLGILTNGYLSALRVLIDNSNLSLVEIVENPSLIFFSEDDEINDERVLDESVELLKAYRKNGTIETQMGMLLKDLWSDYICREKANLSRKILNKVHGLRKDLTKENPLQYLDSLTDRFFLDERYIHFRIKPELKKEIKNITSITIVPSVYASRNLTFWYSENKLLFYIALERTSETSCDPSDMHLLYTSALNDKTRLKMLKHMNGKNCTAGELAQFLDMNASTVSRHLKVFKDAGFVDLHSNDGKQIIYNINRSGIKQAFVQIQTFLLNEEPVQ